MQRVPSQFEKISIYGEVMEAMPKITTQIKSVNSINQRIGNKNLSGLAKLIIDSFRQNSIALPATN